MMHYRRSIAAVTGSIACFGALGCAGRHGAVALAAPYVARAEMPTGTFPRTPIDDAARALGIPVLREAVLPAGTRELRVSDWYSMLLGAPTAVLRLVERVGGPATGQVVFVWLEFREEPTRYRSTRCTNWTNGERRCAFVLRDTGLDWSDIAKRFAQLGAWEITRRCEAEASHISDSGELIIHRLIGAQVDAYECNAPSFRRNTENGRAALALYEYFHTIVRQAGSLPPA